MGKESKDEKMADREISVREHGHPKMHESGIKSDELSGMHIHGGGKNGLSKATEMCRKHNERGEHAPMVGGHKMPY